MWDNKNNQKSVLGLTIAEKILSNHSGKIVRAGELTVADLDFVFGQDGTSGVVIDSFRDMGATKVFDAKKCAMILDHSCPSPIQGVSAIHKKIRDFAKKTGIILHDIGDGVCHQLIPERGYVVSGDLIIGADSHTCTYGALNMCSTGMGSTDVATGMIAGKTWFKVPETIKFICNGKLQKGVYAKDLILFLIGQVRADGATYNAVEYVGEAIKDLSIESRMTICNMAIEMGAKFGIMEFDDKTEKWIRNKTNRDFLPVESDDNAKYFKIFEYDVSKIEPQIAMPHSVDNVVPIKEVLGTKIDEAVLGTCTNGRIEDLEIAANILKGKKINKDVRFIVAPASRNILLEAIEKGYIQTFIKAGAAVVTPGCGPCVGTHNGVPADGENVISTANRNFKGRMGNAKAFIHLASPASVTVAAIEGKITDPRNYI
ncbi:MAG: 3-isopropylmalate dehydratase large subunit [Elusimicrobiota bacterium]|jgi:3-isopropylmalate/(R)-2-methylmalate dehydratase large subunit|nr:3-isopropylmalate dehydratase large subunit [Elusimicrobiota bacterium]